MAKPDWKQLARALGRGGGNASARNLTPKQRIDRARKAGKARQLKAKNGGTR